MGVPSQEGAGEAWSRNLTTAGAGIGSDPRGSQAVWTVFAKMLQRADCEHLFPTPVISDVTSAA